MAADEPHTPADSPLEAAACNMLHAVELDPPSEPEPAELAPPPTAAASADAELEAIEQELEGGPSAPAAPEADAPEPPAAAAPSGAPPKVTRVTLMQDCRAMQRRLELLTGDSKHPLVLKGTSKLKVAEMRALHAELAAALHEAGGSAPAGRGVPAPGGGPPSAPMEQLVGGAMFLSMAAAETLEVAVNNTVDYHGFELEGYARALRVHEEPLKDAYRRILEEEGADGGMAAALGYMNTPYAQLGMIFAVSAMSCAKKKGEASMSSGPPSASSGSL